MLKLFNRKKKDNKGFTLVELVIVIAILAILVGLLAPQYTKYVEKTRKTADANNMEEMIKVVKVYAADPANELPAGHYKITIVDGSVTDKKTEVTSDDVTDTNVITALQKEMDTSIPDYTGLVTKSKKWNGGASSDIVAIVEVTADGGTSVVYDSPSDFKSFMTGSGRIAKSIKDEVKQD